MNDLNGDFGVLVFGIAATLLFIAGYLFTIKEFNEMEPKDDTGPDAHLRNKK